MNSTTTHSNARVALTTTASAPSARGHTGWKGGLVGALVACGLAACDTIPDSSASAPAPSESAISATISTDRTPTSTVPPFVEYPRLPANMLTGVPLEDGDGLTILSAYEILDTARDHVEPVVGLPAFGDATMVATLVEVGGDIVASVHCPMCSASAEPEVYPLRAGVAGPKLAEGFVAAGLEGFWIHTRIGEECELSEIDATGKLLRAARTIDCELTVQEETSLGVLVGDGTGSMLLDPDTLALTELPGRAVAVFDDQALIEHNGDVTLYDPATANSAPLSVPESNGQLGYGRVSPDERHVLIVFGNPAWPGPRQLLDLWVLDTVNLEWSHLPGMPVAAALKSLAFDWTPDGRLVVVGRFDGVGPTIVTWSPSDDTLHTRPTTFRHSLSIIATSTAGPP